MTTSAVYLILEHSGGDILITRRCNTGYQDGNYQVPAGHIELGELPTDAAIREVKEEVGLKIHKMDLELFHVSARPSHDKTGNRNDFFFKVKVWPSEITNMEPDKCDVMTWVHPSQLPENMTPHVKQGIEFGYAGRFYSEITLAEMMEMPLYGLK